jgi:hypothetical protein
MKKIWPVFPGLLLALTSLAQTAASQQFVAGKNISPSQNVGGASAAGDINHDGKLDLLVYDQAAGSFAVLLGNGNGTFTEKVPTTAVLAGGAHLGDLNGDGYLDLVTDYPGGTDNDGLGTGYGQVTVYLGDASGDFHRAFSANIGAGSSSVGLGDVNGDGRLDIITNTSQTFQGTGNLQVFLNTGGAAFQEHNAGNRLGILAVGDLNGDGKADIVGSNGQGYEVLLSNGNGTFKVAGSSADYIFNSFDPVVIRDFNKDGHPDFAVMDWARGTSILLGKSDGTFTLKSQFKSEFPGYPGSGFDTTGPLAMATIDLNHDGKMDLVSYVGGEFQSPTGVTPSNNSFGFVSVNLGNGDGTFKTAPNYSVTFSRPGGGLLVGDFTGDGNPDVVVGGFDERNAIFNSYLQLFAGTGSGALQAPVNTLSADPFSIVHADFNHDGIQDIAVVNQGCAGCSTTVSVFLGSGKGYFSAPKTYAIAQSQGSIAAGDINRDGKVDLVVTRGGQAFVTPAAVPAAAQASTNDDTSVLLGNGDGTFKPAVNSVLLGPAGTSNSAWLVDMNRDGKLDLVGDWGVALGNGNGTFKPPVAFPTTLLWIDGVGVGDFNGDGIQDVVAWTGVRGEIETMLGTGTGSFTAKSKFSYPHYLITDLKVAKMYGTAERDLVFCGQSVDAANARLSTNLVATVHGNGDGTFGTKKIFPLPFLPLSLNYGDYDRDGRLDVVVNDRLGIRYLRGTATGSFFNPPQFFPGSSTYLQSLDVNGDGVLDVVGINPIGFERLINTGKRN